MAKVAVLGPLGTYTHQAAVKRFGPSVELVPYESIPATFEALLASQPDNDLSHAVLPLKNSSFGPVTTTHEFLKEHSSRLHQVDQVTVQIQHMLIRAPQAHATELQMIISHEQALGQCRKYLDTHYPNLERRTSESTASAALYAQQHPEAAAISSRLAGQLFGLDIADEGAEGKGIQDAGLTNETTFGVFVRAETR